MPCVGRTRTSLIPGDLAAGQGKMVGFTMSHAGVYLHSSRSILVPCPCL